MPRKRQGSKDVAPAVEEKSPTELELLQKERQEIAEEKNRLEKVQERITEERQKRAGYLRRGKKETRFFAAGQMIMFGAAGTFGLLSTVLAGPIGAAAAIGIAIAAASVVAITGAVMNFLGNRQRVQRENLMGETADRTEGHSKEHSQKIEVIEQKLNALHQSQDKGEVKEEALSPEKTPEQQGALQQEVLGDAEKKHQNMTPKGVIRKILRKEHKEEGKDIGRG